jgi:hypothetical protein
MNLYRVEEKLNGDYDSTVCYCGSLYVRVKAEMHVFMNVT